MKEQKEKPVNEKKLAREEAKAAKRAEKERKIREREEAKAEKARERAEKRAKNKVARVLVLVLVIVLVLAAIMTGTVAYAGHKLSQSDKIFPGVTVGEIPVGRLTQAEALAALEVKGWNEAVGGTLNVSLPLDTGCQLDYLEAGASLNAEKAAEAAFRYGRGGSVLNSLRTYVHSLHHTTDVAEGETALDEDYIRQRLQDAIAHFDQAAADEGHKVNEADSTLVLLKGAGQMQVDEEELYAKVVEALEARETELSFEPDITDARMPDFEAMHEALFTEARNARYDPETDSIEPDVKGVDFDVEEAQRLWSEAEMGEEVVIPVTITPPAIDEENLREMLFRDMLGERSTSFWGSSENRINNIELVANKLNGLVLQPGEEFSYNGYVGERTAAAGFKSADAYVNGQVKPEIGGGICQVSSTLYNAVLSSQLEIVERTCHMFAVGYLPKGLDATVSWPGPDFKFRNSRDYPIRLKAWVDREETTLTIQIWGSNVDGTYAVPGSSWGKRFDKEWLANGYEVQIGWDAYSWVDIFAADGTQIEHRKGYSSYYALHEEDIVYPEIPAPAASAPEVSIVPDTPAPAPAPVPVPDPTPVPVEPDPTPAPEPVPDPAPDSGSGSGGGESGGEDVEVG